MLQGLVEEGKALSFIVSGRQLPYLCSPRLMGKGCPLFRIAEKGMP